MADTNQPPPWATIQDIGKRWYALMAVAILLHVLAMSNSDLGLDAHVRLNAAMDDGEQGQDLAWGKLRVANSTEQMPTNIHEYDGYIAPWSTSETSVKTTAFVGVLAVACLGRAFTSLGGPWVRVQPHASRPGTL